MFKKCLINNYLNSAALNKFCVTVHNKIVNVFLLKKYGVGLRNHAQVYFKSHHTHTQYTVTKSMSTSRG